MNNNKSNALVSVIVPTYQRHDLLHKTVKSILAQSHRELELLVVSDGNDEKARTLVDNLKDPRARYLFTEHAGLPAVPRNHGLCQSQGGYLAFCDDDDLWHPSKLEKQIPILSNGQYGLCTTDYDYIDQYDKLLDKKNYYATYHGEFNWQTFFHSLGFICNSASMFSREMYEKVGDLNEAPELRAHEDFEYWMRMLFERNGCFISEKLVSYRVHIGSIQKNTPWRVWQSRRSLHRFLKQNLPIPINQYLRKDFKLLMQYVFDAFPFSERLYRNLQGRTS